MPCLLHRKQGWGGLYQGFQAGLASSALGCGLGFTTYEALTVAYRNSLQRAPTPSERGSLAGCAAFCTISACMPLEVIMRRLQARAEGAYLYTSTTDSDLPCTVLLFRVVLRPCWVRMSVQGLHVRGQSALSHSPGFVVPLQPAQHALVHDMQRLQRFACMCVHLQAWLGVQVQGSPGYPVLYRGPLDCVRKIAATEGLRGFYRSGPHAKAVL